MAPKVRARRAVQDLKGAMRPRAALVKKSLCSVSFLTLALKTVGLIVFYYAFSIGLTFYNQRFLHVFKFPLTITMAHLLVKFCLAAWLRSLLECRTGEPRILLPWHIYVTRIAPAGLASVLDIGLSNWSLGLITVSLYTMCKSTAVVFILGFALLLRLEQPRCSLIFVVLFIAGGLFLFTFQSTAFHLQGFLMVMFASVTSGFRWTLAQIVTQKHEIGLHNPLDMMYHIQPWMIVGIMPLVFGFEGMHMSTTDHLFRFEDWGLMLGTVALILLGAGLAFMLEFSEYLLLSNTSSLTLSISGIFKEVCTLYLATEINGDKMTMVNGIGLVMCLCGITLHVILRAIFRKYPRLLTRRHSPCGLSVWCSMMYGSWRCILGVSSQESQGGSPGQSQNRSSSVSSMEEETVEMLTRDGSANTDEDDPDEEEVFNVRRDR